jgi:regulator of RNase E activity RraA
MSLCFVHTCAQSYAATGTSAYSDLDLDNIAAQTTLGHMQVRQLGITPEGIACLRCRDLGGNTRFSGQVSTVKCFENNPLVRKVSS